ncbi:hypothetical protein MAM1_0013c01316 [Mucor ambiguus]|uniref:Uncharacterized protein n=1 Tax=Mucor ambiguus TaxID=91626 RepID=A0A0C9M0X6_9FUNG|nr:hypothetical protein MAM1_0013c01316 [Mucor ambiguus]
MVYHIKVTKKNPPELQQFVKDTKIIFSWAALAKKKQLKEEARSDCIMTQVGEVSLVFKGSTSVLAKHKLRTASGKFCLKGKRKSSV